MIECLKDMSVPEDSKCAYCCYYCNEKESCECKCYGLTKWKTETEIAQNCVESYVEG